MMRRLFPGLVLLATLLSAQAVDRPNILWITAEDMSPNLGSYGDTFARTPHLDAFAAQSVRYTQAFSVAPVCSPSRATLVTGVYANSLGNPHLRCAMLLPPSFEGYPAALRAQGYFTTNNSKTDYNLANEELSVRAWWNRSDGKAHWRQRTPGQPFMAVFNIMDTHQSRSSAFSEEEFEREIGSQLKAAERADPAKAPVPPFYPQTDSARKAMARYYDCITVMDRKVGAILQELEADGLTEDTIVFFYSDHGMGMPGGKRLLWDNGMRVPLLIRFPKKWAHLAPGEPGSTTDRLVNFSDFAPTLLSLAGAPIPNYYQGQAFLGPAAKAERRYVHGARDRVDDAFDTARSIRDERWLYIRNYRPHLSWLPAEGYSDTSTFRRELRREVAAGRLGKGATAWMAPTRPREGLYDTRADPFQLKNLADQPAHAAELQRLRGALRDWLLEIRDASFLAEEETFARVDGHSPYEMARRPGAYPFERILAAAEKVGDDTAAETQRGLLADSDSVVRYWAAVGLFANPQGAVRARTELETALQDLSPAVRVEAAGALARAGFVEDALPFLKQAIWGRDVNVGLHAARTLELLGEMTRPMLPQMRERVREIRQDKPPRSTPEFYLAMSLDALMASLEPPATSPASK